MRKPLALGAFSPGGLLRTPVAPGPGRPWGLSAPRAVHVVLRRTHAARSLAALSASNWSAHSRKATSIIRTRVLVSMRARASEARRVGRPRYNPGRALRAAPPQRSGRGRKAPSPSRTEKQNGSQKMLVKDIREIRARPMPHTFAEHCSDSPRIGVETVSCHSVWRLASHR